MQKGFFPALQIAWQLGYTIAIPIVLLALLGRFLDKKLHTSPWLLLAGIVLSIAISSFGLVMQFKKIVSQIEAEGKQDKPKLPKLPRI